MSALDLKLNGVRDLALDAGGDAALVGGAGRVAQGIGIALRTWLGEYFLDSEFGVPFLDTILVKSPNIAAIEAALRSVIRNVEGVDSVTSLTATLDRKSRALSVAFEAKSGDSKIADTILLSE